MLTNGHTPEAVQTLARKVRSGWSKVRPIPLPAYGTDVPKIGTNHELDIFLPPTAATLAAAATSEDVARRVVAVLRALQHSPEIEQGIVFYEFGREKFGPHWRYADLLTTVCAAAGLVRPQNYLEIGVWRGRSTSVVGATWPTCDIYGFDMWIPDYYGVDNPGPDFVREQLARAGHKGKLELISGDSRETLPAFLRAHPDLYFDMITIDGDKSIPGCASDFAHALPRLKVGGIVVFDDLPLKPALRRIWNKMVAKNVRYVAWEFIDGSCGVAAAVRVWD
jgi:predicted O-methyltransferase YrrM